MSTKAKAAVAVLSLLAPIIISYIPNWLGEDVSFAEQLLFGVIVFVAILLVELLILVDGIASTRRHDELQMLLDTRLIAIRVNYLQVITQRTGKKDLFVDHFEREIQVLADTLKRAATDDELCVSNHHFGTVDKVMATFLGERNPVHRNVWILASHERLFEIPADQEYFRLLVAAASKKKIAAVKTLFVTSDEDALLRPANKAFLDFYKTHDRFDCQILAQSAFDSVRKDTVIQNECIDFGIYGKGMMFLTTSYGTDRVGIFVKKSARVKKYTEFFDRIWNSRIATQNPSIATNGRPLDDLIELDNGGKASQNGV